MSDKTWYEKEDEEKEEEKKDAPLEDSTQPVQPAKKRKTPAEKEVVAVKTCTFNLEGAKVRLVKGTVVKGLTSQELAHLKAQGVVTEQ